MVYSKTNFSGKITKTYSKPKTQLKTSGNNAIQIFNDTTGRSRQKIEKYQLIYDTGGYISQALDCYPQYILMESTNGFKTMGENERNNAYIHDILNNGDWYNTLYDVILSAAVSGDGMAEITYDVKGRMSLQIRNPAYFTAHYDQYGLIDYYIYKLNESDRDGIKVEVKDILHLTIKPGANFDQWGLSYIGVAYDEIIRDTKIVESITFGMERHGTPKWIAKIGTEENPIDEGDFSTISSQFKNINSKTEFVVDQNVDIKPIDTSGITGVDEYSTFSLERTLGGLGVPGEIIGFTNSANIGTAKTVTMNFMKKIKPLQKRLNSQLYNQLFKPMLQKQFGNSDSVFIDFGETQENTMKERFEMVKMIQHPINPEMVLSIEEQRDLIGYLPREDEEYDIIEEEDEEPETEL